jgi:hypothetical protein
LLQLSLYSLDVATQTKDDEQLVNCACVLGNLCVHAELLPSLIENDGMKVIADFIDIDNVSNERVLFNVAAATWDLCGNDNAREHLFQHGIVYVVALNVFDTKPQIDN